MSGTKLAGVCGTNSELKLNGLEITQKEMGSININITQVVRAYGPPGLLKQMTCDPEYNIRAQECNNSHTTRKKEEKSNNSLSLSLSVFGPCRLGRLYIPYGRENSI